MKRSRGPLVPAFFTLLGILTISGHGLLAQSKSAVFWSWADTPPMGWNSYDCWGDTVTEEQTLANARYMKDHLLPHGWQYVVIDWRWYDDAPPDTDGDVNRLRTGARLAADNYGRLHPAINRFPSAGDGRGFRPLADQIHAMGLKFGFHLMRGIPRQAVQSNSPIEGSTFRAVDAGDIHDTCKWCSDMYGVRNNQAGQDWYDSLLRLYASWGADFIKVDDLSEPYHANEIEMIRKAIDKCGRPIIFSTSPGPTNPSHADHLKMNANQWRISGDFWDRWENLNRQFDTFAKWNGINGPGHFPDGDMIPFGHIGIRSHIAGLDRKGRFTEDEERTLISLWCLEASPLILGSHLPDLDEQTLAFLTNDEVLAIDQDPLGLSAKRILQKQGTEIWTKTLKDSSTCIGLFNRSGKEATVTFESRELGLDSSRLLRDLWQKKDLGPIGQSYSCTIPAHGAVLLKTNPL